MTKWCVCFWVVGELLFTAAQAEPYQFIAGSSALGLRENDKQTLNLGFKTVFNELLSASDVKCDFQSFDSSEDLAAAISKNQVSAFFGSPIEFLRSEPFLLSSPIASGVYGNQLKYKILLLVRKDSGINSLEQLQGKRLSTQKWVARDMEGLYLETLLLEHQLPITKNFFSQIQNNETTNAALVDLFFKKVDAALVNESQYEVAAELNPQLRAQTQILEASEPYIIFVTAFTKSIPEQKISSIRNSLLSVEKTSAGRNVLRLMKAQGFKEIPLSELDNVRTLIAKNKRLKMQQNEH